jgi:hypothetical protein
VLKIPLNQLATLGADDSADDVEFIVDEIMPLGAHLGGLVKSFVRSNQIIHYSDFVPHFSLTKVIVICDEFPAVNFSLSLSSAYLYGDLGVFCRLPFNFLCLQVPCRRWMCALSVTRPSPRVSIALCACGIRRRTAASSPPPLTKHPHGMLF